MGPGFGSLNQNEKAVVLFEVDGPKTKHEMDQFNKAVEDLLKKFGGKLKYTVIGLK